MANDVEPNASNDHYDDMVRELVDMGDFDQIAAIFRSKDALEEQVNLPEAGGSVTGFLVSPGGWEFQVTSRGESPEAAWSKMLPFIRRMLAEGYKTSVKNRPYQPASSEQPKSDGNSGQPAQQSSSNNDVPLHEGEFVVDRVEITQTGDKRQYKLVGGPWSKFGITVWPEPLAAAKIEMSKLVHGQPIPGGRWIAQVQENVKDGKTLRKVIGLRRG